MELQRQALDDYLNFTSFLTAEVGQEVVRELVPDYEEALRLADTVLTAMEQDDQDTVIRTTDYGKKMLLVERYLSGRQGSWRENLDGIRNICFAFASPQEISPYYNYFRSQGLETLVLDNEDLRAPGRTPARGVTSFLGSFAISGRTRSRNSSSSTGTDSCCARAAPGAVDGCRRFRPRKGRSGCPLRSATTRRRWQTCSIRR